MIKKLVNSLVSDNHVDRRTELYRKLLRREAMIGGQLFGPLKPGGRREFFCLDARTWVWHEEWLDEDGQRHIKTTRYDVHPDKIVKSQNGHYQQTTREEAARLVQAARLYKSIVKGQLYSNVS